MISKKEYLGTYEIPNIELYHYKILANNYNEARQKFLDKLLENQEITKYTYDEFTIGYYDYLEIICLSDIELIK